MKKGLAVLLAAIGTAGILAVTGCGSSNDSSSTSTTTPTTTTTATTPPASTGGTKSATRLSIAADKNQLKFSTDKLSAKAGKVTIAMTNPSTVPHAVAIEGNGVEENGTGGTAGVGEGQKSTVSANLKAGTYTFYCPVDGHKQAGMEGTLTVK